MNVQIVPIAPKETNVVGILISGMVIEIISKQRGKMNKMGFQVQKKAHHPIYIDARFFLSVACMISSST